MLYFQNGKVKVKVKVKKVVMTLPVSAKAPKHRKGLFLLNDEMNLMIHTSYQSNLFFPIKCIIRDQLNINLKVQIYFQIGGKNTGGK